MVTGNSIGADGATALASALPQLVHLTLLDLQSMYWVCDDGSICCVTGVSVDVADGCDVWCWLVMSGL